MNTELYEYVTEVGGICEKISFSENLTAPGAAVRKELVMHHSEHEDRMDVRTTTVVESHSREECTPFP